MAKSTRKLMKSLFCRPNHKEGHLMGDEKACWVLWVVIGRTYVEKISNTRNLFFVDHLMSAKRYVGPTDDNQVNYTRRY